ncbi:NTP transferase domain-containing protein [Bacillus sp. NA_165.1]|uniref:NTP transferase domain-containing protein n=1 Tax=unclassified Bacillus (in: firmicutes) TaxID=185979 RepID=UPI0040464F88
MKIVGIYLAAGKSTRTGPGLHKLYLQTGNTLLGNKALYTSLSSNLSDVIVVSNQPSWLLHYNKLKGFIFSLVKNHVWVNLTLSIVV